MGWASVWTLLRPSAVKRRACANWGLMTAVRCRHLPVVVNGAVVGIVSIGDLVRIAGGDQEYELRALHEYVEGRSAAS
jgi:CBS domain-containing protein